MSHYNKWSGGYFYGKWTPKKKEEDKDKSKSSSSPTKTSYSGGYGGGYGSYYGSGYTYYGYDYDDDEVVDYESIYRNRYKSSIGYSGLGGSLSSYYGSYGSSWSGYKSSKVSASTSEDFKELTELISKATKEARDLVVILDFPFSINLSFTKVDDDPLPPNTRRIFIPTKYFGDTAKTIEDKVRIFCSLAVNEAAHLKYTEYRVYESFKDSISSYSESDIKFMDVLFNLLEDERVEDQLLRGRPGYLDFVEKDKAYQYENFLEATKLIKDTKASKFLLNLFKLIRFPKNVDMDVIKEFNDLYETIGSIITPAPDSTKQTCIFTKELFNEITKIMSSDDFKTELDGAGISISNLLSELASAGGSAFQNISGGFDVEGDDSAIKSSDILSSINDEKTGKMLSKLTSGGAFIGTNSDTFFTVIKGDKAKYDYEKELISRYIPGIRKLIQGYDKNFDFNIFGCRSGLLDTTKLAEAYQGVPQVYVRKGTVVTNKLAVVVLIDESGSMGWYDHGSHATRIALARRGAILLNEALKNQPGVELFIYGHSGDILYPGSTEINIYREGNNSNPYALSEAMARSENRDGVAIYEVASRVRKLTSSHMLMFVLSDGYPAADNYWGDGAIRHVRKKVTEVQQKMDADVIQISIEYIPHAGRMFDTFIDISGDVANMSKNLSQTIKKLIIKNKKSVITQ